MKGLVKAMGLVKILLTIKPSTYNNDECNDFSNIL